MKRRIGKLVEALRNSIPSNRRPSFSNGCNNPEKPLLIIGHGRSGTSWVGAIISSSKLVQYYYEPCNPELQGIRDFDLWFRYLRPGEEDDVFTPALDAAFGGLSSPGSHRNGPQRSRCRIVVKEVAPVMSLSWLIDRYDPDVLVIVRHPGAVILSELNKGTPVRKSKKALLHQDTLFADHLNPYRQQIERAQSPHEILGVVWGARHRVILNALAYRERWKIVYYEDLCFYPLREYRKIFTDFRLNWDDRVARGVAEHSSTHEPGIYSVKRVSAQQVNQWRQKIAPPELVRIKEIIDPFDLPFYRDPRDWA